MESNYLALAAAMLRQGISEMIVSTGYIWGNDRIMDIRGSFMIANVQGGGQVFDATYPFRVRNITAEALLELFSVIAQSNDDLSIYDVTWTFIFDPRSVMTGNGTRRKIPSFVDTSSSVELDSWVTNTFNEQTINCAAFCLASKTCGTLI